MEITRQISQYNHSDGNDIQYIVMHDTGNDRDTAAGNANYFNGGDRQASAHYFVDENSIYQVVEENQAAWHCGDGHGIYGIDNHNSLGIEMCNSGGYIADSTINNTIGLVKSLMSKYSIPIDRVVRHYDASRKDCPHNMSANNWSKWNEFKSKLSGPQYTPDFIKSVQHDLQRVSCLAPGETLANGQLDNRTKEAIRNFRNIVGLTDNYELDNSVVSALNSITKKPNIGIAWPENPTATKFIQWWIGITKTGKWDVNMVSKVIIWQTQNKIWGNPDGVIREKDWNKILK